MKVHRIELQPHPGGFKVNSWFLEGERPALVDCGYKTEYCQMQLQSALKKLGYQYEEIRVLFVTHPHIDHQGLAGFLQREGKCEILIPESGSARFFSYSKAVQSQLNYWSQVFQESGVPEEWIRKTILQEERTEQLAEGIVEGARVRQVRSMDRVYLGDQEWVVYDTPGHSSSHISLYSDATGAFFSGDLILANEPTSLILDGGAAGISSLLRSHDLVRNLNVTAVYPGHGHRMDSPFSMLEKREGLTKYRLQKILNYLGKGPDTAYSIALYATPKLHQHFLVYFLETYAHLLYAQELELIESVPVNNRLVWQLKKK